MKKVLTIAGSDCSGGAGIQADLKTMTAHGVYAMSVITALTAQNTTGVCGVCDCPAEFVAKQLDCVFGDIRPDAVKIGMVSNGETAAVIAEKLIEYHAENIVLDPVMVATSGGVLMKSGAVDILIEKLFPIADVIIPNIPEAGAICQMAVNSHEDMQKAAEKLSKICGGAVVIKGGHLADSADDLLYHGGRFEWFKADRINTENTHGTGCTLSSAIACGLAMGFSVREAYSAAKIYLTSALSAGLDLGRGNGPIDHCFAIREAVK